MSKRWNITVLTLIALMALVLFGCSGPDVAAGRAAVNRAKAEVSALQAQVANLTEIAEASNNETIKAAALAAQNALKVAEAKIPEMEAALKNLEDSTPAWKAALLFAIPYVPRAALLIPGVAAIPGAGPLLEMLARLVSNAAWLTTATKKQKQEDV